MQGWPRLLAQLPMLGHLDLEIVVAKTSSTVVGTAIGLSGLEIFGLFWTRSDR
jgi:hypothetical protein